MDSVVDKVKEHCLNLLTKSRCEILPFHNMKHTLEVFKIAALLHDTGDSEVYNGPENFSSYNAQIFLMHLNYPSPNIKEVINCINATKMPQLPTSILQHVICDADLFHLSTTAFIIKNKLLIKPY